MEKKAETKKELIEDLVDLLQQPADVKKSRPKTKNSLQALKAFAPEQLESEDA